MVAITVVLAAVLYVMVSGLIGPTGGGGPQISLLPAVGTVNPNEYKLEIGAVSKGELFTNFQVTVLDTSTNTAVVAVRDLAGGNMTAGCTTSCLSYTDLNGDTKVTGGDFFVVKVPTGKTYQVTLIWKASGSRLIAGSVPS